MNDDPLTQLEVALKVAQSDRALGALRTAAADTPDSKLFLEAGIAQGLDLALIEIQKLRAKAEADEKEDQDNEIAE